MKKRLTLLTLACGLLLLEGNAAFSNHGVTRSLAKNIISVRRAKESNKTS